LEDVVSEEAVVDVSKRLIIDASIAGAAGKERPEGIAQAETTLLTRKNCRDVLSAVRVAMVRAGRLELNASCHSEKLRDAIMGVAGQKIGKIKITQEVCHIMLKDCHLLEAALATDNTIIALDEKARKPLKTTAQVLEKIQSIVWVNPDKPEEEAIAWLEAGAEPDKHRQLGFR
jgi:hypothetical protein